MAKTRYLSATEKTIVLTIASFTAYLDDRVNTWEGIKRPKDQIKYTKMAKSFLQKVVNIMMKDISEEQLVKLIGGDVVEYRRGPGGAPIRRTVHVDGELHKMLCVVKYKDDAEREYKKMAELDGNVAMPVGDLDKIIDFALASCNLCELCGDDVKNCDIRQLFIKYHANPLNQEPGDGCPYRQA